MVIVSNSGRPVNPTNPDRSPDLPRPLIGLTTYEAPAQWGVWSLPAALLPLGYVEALVGAGSRPVLLPPMGEAVAATLEPLGGIVFTGGPDLAPALYGQAPHPATTAGADRRDEAELALMAEALRRDLPVLGICRGAELLNIALGGTLSQHLPDELGASTHLKQGGVFAQHQVVTTESSRMHQVLGPELAVSSYHHQGLARLGTGLTAVAHAPDGTVEAIEAPSKRCVWGVLWHPEAGSDPSLFEAFVTEAAAHRDLIPTARRPAL